MNWYKDNFYVLLFMMTPVSSHVRYRYRVISALFDAVEHQDLDAVKDILETNGIDINR